MHKIPNGANGIMLDSVQNVLVGSDAGSTVAKNIISGNAQAGILIQGGSNNTVNNSVIGTDTTGTTGLGNTGDGIVISDSSQNLLGDSSSDFALRNSISGNLGSGVRIDGALSSSNKLNNNLIGLTPGFGGLGNSSYGVLITNGASSNEVGDLTDVTTNYVVYSGNAGVRIDETAGQNNLVHLNAIFGNVGLAIDLSAVGITSNDPGDADEGSNRLQNFPEFVSAFINSGGDLVLTYRVDSSPANSNYSVNGLSIEFFKADASPNSISWDANPMKAGSTSGVIKSANAAAMPAVRSADASTFQQLISCPLSSNKPVVWWTDSTERATACVRNSPSSCPTLAPWGEMSLSAVQAGRRNWKRTSRRSSPPSYSGQLSSTPTATCLTKCLSIP